MDKPISLTNKSGFYTKNNKENSIFSNVYIILLILLIAFSFMGYAVYYYLYHNDNDEIIKDNSSYYGEDITNYEPIFKDTTNAIDDCINICKNDIICDGITYNLDTKACIGTKNGKIRNENSNYSAWIKPESNKISNFGKKKDFTKTILVGYTKTMIVINGQNIDNPYKLGNMCYSFNLTIYDFYKNYGSWRHIFHRGSPINTGEILNYQSWENLIVDYPMQIIGVWLAPFTNNLRIAVTTNSIANTVSGSYPDAFIEKCDDLTKTCYITDAPSGKWANKLSLSDGKISKPIIEKYIEYFDHDLQNIPLNTQINITLNLRGQDVEVLLNGKIIKVNRLDGIPDTNKGKPSLYVMNDKTFGGEISNLIYYPDALSIVEIKSIIDLQPQNINK